MVRVRVVFDTCMCPHMHTSPHHYSRGWLVHSLPQVPEGLVHHCLYSCGLYSYGLHNYGLRYLKGWFIIDFASSIPFDFILKSAMSTDDSDGSGAKISGAETKLLKIVRLLRLAKLIKLLRASRIFR